MKIEYVCTGNNGRSPMAEAIAIDYVIEKGLDLEITSSGTYHNPLFINQRDNPESFPPIIELGLKNDVFRGRIKTVAEGVLKGTHDSVEECIEYLVQAEAIFRDMALLEIGLLADGKYHQPTVAKDIDILLTMTLSNANHAKQIYANSRFNPVITTINEYAHLPGEINNPFCQLYPAYQKTREDLLVAIPKTIERTMKDSR